MQLLIIFLAFLGFSLGSPTPRIVPSPHAAEGKRQFFTCFDCDNHYKQCVDDNIFNRHHKIDCRNYTCHVPFGICEHCGYCWNSSDQDKAEGDAAAPSELSAESVN